MAYYAPVTNLPIATTDHGKENVREDGVGAYYAQDATHEAVQPINGLAGGMGPSAELADEAARTILGRRRPIMVASEWATAITDINWREKPRSSTELTLLPMSDHDLRAVRQAAFGHGLPVVGILSNRPSSLAHAEAAFRGTPYDFHQLIAVSSIGDRRPLPSAFFLFVGSERDPDDRDGGGGLLQQTAEALSGKLVHIISLEARVVLPPRPPIATALRAQFSSSSAKQRPVVPGAPPLPPTAGVIAPGRQPVPLPVAAPQPMGSTQAGLVGALGVGAVALGVGYFLTKGKH